MTTALDKEENGKSLTTVIDIDGLIFSDVSLRNLKGTKFITYIIESKEKEYFLLESNIKNTLTKILMILHFLVNTENSNNFENVSKLNEIMLEFAERLGLHKHPDYKEFI